MRSSNGIPPELMALLGEQAQPQQQMQAPELADWRQYTGDPDKREVVPDDTMGPITEDQRFRGRFEPGANGGSGYGQGKKGGQINSIMGGFGG